MKRLYTISVVFHNEWEVTRECLDGLVDFCGDVPGGSEVIFSDNGSSDGSFARLCDLTRMMGGRVKVLPGWTELTIGPLFCRYIRHDRNLGFGEAHNIACGIADGVYLLVLNNDCVLERAGVLEALRAEFLEDPKLGAAGPFPARLDGTGHGGILPAVAEADGFDYLEGSCVMVLTHVVRALEGGGLFSPAFRFAYCEDADLCLRLRRQGYGLAAVDGLAVAHRGGATLNAAGVREAIDFDGLDGINHLTLRRRWAGYLESGGGGLDDGRTILVRRTGALGDVLLVTPVLRELRRRFANARIVVETACQAVFEECAVDARVWDECIFLDEVSADPWMKIDLDAGYERAPRMNLLDAYAAVAGSHFGPSCGDADECSGGFMIRDRRPLFFPNALGREEAWILLQEHGLTGGRADRAAAVSGLDPEDDVDEDGVVTPYAVVHADGFDPGWAGRDWGSDRFGELAELVRAELGLMIVLVGTDLRYDGSWADVDLRGRTPDGIGALAGIIERARLFLGNDSFPMHLAIAAQIPVVAVFGKIDPALRFPVEWGFVRGVTAGGEAVSCLGCHHEFAVPATVSGCVRADGREVCMERVSVGMVFAEVMIAMNEMGKCLETSKIREAALRYCVGQGADLGCGRDKIAMNAFGVDDDAWPEVDIVGDIRKLDWWPDGCLDFVYSSHALEDLADTRGVLAEWLRVLRSGGNLILYVPDPDLYKGCNVDHVHAGFKEEDLLPILVELGCERVDGFTDSGKDRYSTFLVVRKVEGNLTADGADGADDE